MRLLNLNDVEPLLAGAHGPCVSLYLTRPKNELGERIAATKMIQLLRRTEALLKPSLTFKEIRKFMRPLWSFRRDLFWKSHRSLALFHSEKISGYLPLSMEVPELTVVADSFHLKPILKRIQEQERLWVLSLSQKNAQLFRWADGGLELVESVSSTEWEMRGWSLFVNSPGALRGIRSNVSDADYHREIVNRFFRKVDSAIQPHLAAGSVPLVLAGVGYLHPIFRAITQYSFVSDSGIEGSFKGGVSQSKLLHRVREVSEELKRHQEKRLQAEYEEAALAHRGLDDLSLVVRAALQGQVHKLFVAEDRQIWGTLDEKRGAAILHPYQMSTHDDDVLDDLAELVVKKGGAVHVLPSCKMPTISPAAAILRWPHSEKNELNERNFDGLV